MKSKKYNIDEIIEKYIEMYDAGMICDVRIGTDSQLHSVNGNRIYKFVTVVLLHYNSSSKNFSGGDERISILWDKKTYVPNKQVGNIVSKMIEETQKTIEIAEEISQYIDRENVVLELDINSKISAGSQPALEACKGMCAGYGYSNITWKPNTLITYAADVLCKTRTMRKEKREQLRRELKDMKNVSVH